jgi:hypothetical protein
VVVLFRRPLLLVRQTPEGGRVSALFYQWLLQQKRNHYARLFPPHRNEHRRFVICVRDAEKPVNALLLQPLAYRLLQYAPVGAMKYLHFHLQRFS